MTDLFAALDAKRLQAQEPGLARADHPETSKEAAASVATRAHTQRERILRMLIALQSPATRECLENALTMKGNSVRPRLRELEDRRLVRRTGEHGLTSSGHKAELLAITERGRQAIAHIDNTKGGVT
jgi:repressor of nif and glnA expression